MTNGAMNVCAIRPMHLLRLADALAKWALAVLLLREHDSRFNFG